MSDDGVNREGGRRRRVGKLVDGASSYLEAGETVREVVQVQTGQSAMETAGGIANLGGPGSGSFPSVSGSFALMATDTHVYAMPLKGSTLTRVEKPVLKIELDQAQVRREGSRIFFGGKSFHVMWLFGRRAKSFTAFVQRRSGS